MAEKTDIQWTKRPGTIGATWNPTVGCSIISPGCTHCYAQVQAHDLVRRFGSTKYAGLAHVVNGHPVWNGVVRLDEDALRIPLKWKKPHTVFVNSMSDLFHEALTDEQIDRVFAAIALCPQHTFQVLTKRAARMRVYFDRDDRDYMIGVALGNMLDGEWIWKEGKRFRPAIEEMISIAHGEPIEEGEYPIDLLPLPNVWLGVSCERQREADLRIPDLLNTPAAIRFISVEPLIDAIDLTAIRYKDEDAEIRINALTGEAWVENSNSASVYTNEADGNTKLSWAIAGGESGAGARRCDIDWIDTIVRQCQAAGTPVFVKQLGAKPTLHGFTPYPIRDSKGGDMNDFPEHLKVREWPVPQHENPGGLLHR